MSPTLYIFHGSPPCRAVLITAKALGVPLNIHEVDGDSGEILSPAYLKLNPQHTVPTLNDNGNLICDSHAINAYLVSKYGKDDALYPKDPYKRALVDQRLHFDTGVLFPAMRSIWTPLMKKEIKTVPASNIEEIKEAYGFLEKFLEGRQWVAGDSVTIADFSCYTAATSLNIIAPIDSKAFPHVASWMKRTQALPWFASDPEEIESFRVWFSSILV